MFQRYQPIQITKKSCQTTLQPIPSHSSFNHQIIAFLFGKNMEDRFAEGRSCITDVIIYCPLYSNERCKLLSSLANMDYKLLDNTNFFLQKKTKKDVTLQFTYFYQLRNSMGLFMNSIFSQCSPSNNESSYNKTILSEATLGLLGYQRLFSASQPFHTTTLSSIFDVVEALDPLLLILRKILLFYRKFQFILNQIQLNLIAFNLAQTFSSVLMPGESPFKNLIIYFYFLLFFVHFYF